MIDKTNPSIAVPKAPPRVVDDVGDYARVSAAVRHSGDEQGTLAALGIEAADWARARRWGSKLAAAAFRGDRGPIDAFTAAFRTEIERLRAAVSVSVAGVGSAQGAPGSDQRQLNLKLSVLEASNAAAERPLAPELPEGVSEPKSTELAAATGARETRELAFVAAREVLPFNAGARSTLLERTEAPRSAPTKANDDPLDRTLSVEVLRPPELVLPFAPVPTISVEQYASMRASLEVFPDKRAVILARYGIGDEAHFKSVCDAFTAEFTNDPPTHEAFLRRFEDVRARLGAPR